MQMTFIFVCYYVLLLKHYIYDPRMDSRPSQKESKHRCRGVLLVHNHMHILILFMWGNYIFHFLPFHETVKKWRHKLSGFSLRFTGTNSYVVTFGSVRPLMMPYGYNNLWKQTSLCIIILWCMYYVILFPIITWACLVPFYLY